jgi:hypothetical protein
MNKPKTKSKPGKQTIAKSAKAPKKKLNPKPGNKIMGDHAANMG